VIRAVGLIPLGVLASGSCEEIGLGINTVTVTNALMAIDWPSSPIHRRFRCYLEEWYCFEELTGRQMTENKNPAQAPETSEALLYHYTDLTAFQNIVDNGKLWATHIHYLNDTSEQRLFEHLVRSRIQARQKTASSKTRARMRSWLQRLTFPKVPFVVCFSQDGGNRLSQWRGYAAHGGISIGFKEPQLEAFCKLKVTEGFGLSLRKVLYVKPEGEDLTNQIIDNLLNVDLDALAPKLPEEEMLRLAQTLALYFGVSIKHRAFEEEKESRLVLFRNSQTLGHRVRGSLMVPYLELEVGPHFETLVEEVIVGPSAHKEQTAEAVKNMLAIKGWGSVKAKCSDMPYRGW
jgi:hypothetical protein